MDPHLSQQHAGIQHTALRPEPEVNRPKAHRNERTKELILK